MEVRLIDGMAELLLCVDIIRKPDISVVFPESNQFSVGQGESAMATYNKTQHWVFLLVPTDCAYTKMNEYFSEIKREQIEVLQVQ